MPHLLHSPGGGVKLNWIKDAIKPKYLEAFGMTRQEVHAFVGDWPQSEEGRRLLEGLRCAVAVPAAAWCAMGWLDRWCGTYWCHGMAGPMVWDLLVPWDGLVWDCQRYRLLPAACFPLALCPTALCLQGRQRGGLAAPALGRRAAPG